MLLYILEYFDVGFSGFIENDVTTFAQIAKSSSNFGKRNLWFSLPFQLLYRTLETATDHKTLLVFRFDDQNEHRSVFDCVCIATDAPICWFSKAFNVRWSVWQASLICRANFSVIWNFLETQFAITHGIMYQRLFFFIHIQSSLLHVFWFSPRFWVLIIA